MMLVVRPKFQPSVPNCSISGDAVVCNESTVTLKTLDDPSFSYRWDATGGTFYDQDLSTIEWMSPAEPGEYFINLTVGSEGLFPCSSTHKIVVKPCTSNIFMIKDCIYDEPVRVGDVVVYTYEISNTGDLPLENIDLSDIPDWGGNCDPLYVIGDLDNDNVLDPGESWIYDCEYTISNPADYGQLTIMSNDRGSTSMMMLVQKLSRMMNRLEIKLNGLKGNRNSFDLSKARQTISEKTIEDQKIIFYNYINEFTAETLNEEWDDQGRIKRSEYYDPIADAVLTTEYNLRGEVRLDSYMDEKSDEYLEIEYHKPEKSLKTYTVIDYRTGDTLIVVTDAIGVVISMEYKKTPGYLPHEKRIWLRNTATVNATDPRGKVISDWDVYSLEIERPLPNLLISKRAHPDPAEAGGIVTYIVDYQNAGDVEANNAVIEEIYDENVTFLSSTPPPDMGTENQWSLGSLMKNASGTISLVVLVDSALPSGSMLNNTVNITCAELVNSTTTVLTKVIAPQLVINKTGSPDPVDAGGVLNYSINYVNEGDAVAHDVIIREFYDENVTFLSSYPLHDDNFNDRWTLENLLVNQGGTIDISVNIPAQIENGTLINNTVNITCAEGISDQISINTTVWSPLLEIEKTANPPLVRPGESFNYSITLRNVGYGNATNVTVTDIIDSNLNFNNSTPDASGNSNNTYWWNFSSLEIGGEETIEIKVDVPKKEDFTPNIVYNKYKVDCDQSEGCYKVLPTFVVSSLWINKTAENSTYSAGDYVRYNITYGNDLEDVLIAKDVMIVDHLPDVEYINATPLPNFVNDKILTWDIGDLRPNENHSIELFVRIPERPEVKYEETSSVTGDGFVFVNKRLTTSRPMYTLLNKVNITGYYLKNGTSIKSQASSSSSISVRKVEGTVINSMEHGSGYYEGDQLAKLNTTNKSIQLDKSIFAYKKETSFSLPGERELNFNSSWFDSTCAKNYLRGEILSEKYRYMKNIEKDSSFHVDENQTTYDSDSQFSGGMVKIEFLQKDLANGEPIVELSDNYHGSFSVEETLDSYGSGVSSTKSARGNGMVIVDKRISGNQRSFERGSGYYDSDEIIKTGSIYKEVKMIHIPTTQEAGNSSINYTSTWYEGMCSKGDGSIISDHTSSVEYIYKDALMDSSSMASFSEFDGKRDLKVVGVVDGGEMTWIDQTFIGDYRVSSSIGISKKAKHMAPHINVTKTAVFEDEDRVLFTINVTNDGNKPLDLIYVNDTLPQEMTFINSSLRPAIDGQQLSWTILSLPISGLQSIKLWAKPDGYGHVVVNQVNVTGRHEGGIVTSNCSCSVDTAVDWLSSSFISAPLVGDVMSSPVVEDTTIETDGIMMTAEETLLKPSDDYVVVNLMIDAELSPQSFDMTPEDRWDLEVNSIVDMLNVVIPKELNVTVYVTGDYVTSRAGNASYKLYVTRIGANSRHELAMSGQTTDEMLGLLSYKDQYPLFRNVKRNIEDAYICDGLPVEVKGFRPQNFNQSEVTYKIVDKIGLMYDAGYMANLIYLSDHQNDTWPYPTENYNFYAVPVSTHQISGTYVPISDKYAKEKLKLTGPQWYELLVEEYMECAENNDPMVVMFNNVVVGSDQQYMDAFEKFVDYAASKDSIFLKTLELVEVAKYNRELSPTGDIYPLEYNVLKWPPNYGYEFKLESFEDKTESSYVLLPKDYYGIWCVPDWNFTLYDSFDCHGQIVEYYENLDQSIVISTDSSEETINDVEDSGLNNTKDDALNETIN